MRESCQGSGVGQQCAKVCKLCAPGFRVVDRAYRMLHERIGDDDEIRRDIHRNSDNPNRERVHPGGNTPPAENPQSQESGFQEECDEAFKSQRAAEDITDHAGVLRPVHTELEFLDDTRGYAHGEVNNEDGAEKPRRSVPKVIFRRGPQCLHERDERS